MMLLFLKWLYFNTMQFKLYANTYRLHRVLRHIYWFINQNFIQDLKSMEGLMPFKIDSTVLIKNVSNVITP